jgi:hypothetical protein
MYVAHPARHRSPDGAAVPLLPLRVRWLSMLGRRCCDKPAVHQIAGAEHRISSCANPAASFKLIAGSECLNRWKISVTMPPETAYGINLLMMTTFAAAKS